MATKIKQFFPAVLKILFAIETIIETGMLIFNGLSRVYARQYKKLEKYNPNAIVGMFTGLILAFFGGWFIVTVAMVEAFKQGGAHRLWDALRELKEELDAVKEANEEDDKVDADNDGVADVLQISKDELAKRKLMVALKAMNPIEVQNAFSSLWTATVSAAATVKLQFARTIALGISIGNYLSRPVIRYLVPILELLTDPVYHKWYPSVAEYICRMIGTSIAFQIQRVLSTVSTAVRGGNMMIDHFADWSTSRNMAYLNDGYLDDILAWGLVVVGIYAQLFVFTYLPFLIKLMIFPLFLCEWILTTLVSTV